MFVAIILVIINTLLIISLNSTLGLKTNQYKNNIVLNKEEKLILQEKMIIEAIDSYCRKNVLTCFNELKYNNKKKTFTIAELEPYMPNNTVIEKLNETFYKLIELKDINKIELTHQIGDVSIREKYFENRLNKNENITCINSETKPCVSSTINKIKNISPDLEIKFIEEEIKILEAKLLEPENYPGEYNDINAEIAVYNDKKNVFQTEVNNRKVENFKGE